MDDTGVLRSVVSELLDKIGRTPLKGLMFEPLDPTDLDQYLARLRVFVAPSYLPFATYDGGIVAIHLWPGRDLRQSPILYIPDDQQEARFVCDRLATLPTGLWLWVSQYFDDRPEQLRDYIDSVTATIPSAQPVPEALWQLLAESPEFEPTWWFPDCEEYTNRAWQMGKVGHPFVGLPQIRIKTEPAEALNVLQPFVAQRADVPELLAILLATQAEAGIARNKSQIMTVLSAEAWRELGCLLTGWWRITGTGMCGWGSTLRGIDNPRAALGGTPFEPLIDHPSTYSGEDKHGPIALMEVAKRYRQAGDHEAELRQLRNAATLQVLAWGSCRLELAQMIAKTCDTISPDSLAAAVARESARVYPQGP